MLQVREMVEVLGFRGLEVTTCLYRMNLPERDHGILGRARAGEGLLPAYKEPCQDLDITSALQQISLNQGRVVQS